MSTRYLVARLQPHTTAVVSSAAAVSSSSMRALRNPSSAAAIQSRLFSSSALRPHSYTSSSTCVIPCALHPHRAHTIARSFSTEAAAAAASTAAEPQSEKSSTTTESSTSTATPTVDPKVVELQEDVKKKDAQIKDLQDKYTRALAEAQNTLTRSQKQIADAKQFAVQSFAKSLLEVADILEIATKAAEPHAAATQDTNFKNLYEGVAMTQKVLLATFERNGLKKFEPLGEKFDPYFQEGLLQMEDATKTPGTVGIVLKSGYKLHERCLRAAQVGTVKAPAKTE